MLSDAYDMMTKTKAQLTGDIGRRNAYGAHSLRFARSYFLPFGRLWYVKAAVNHMLYQQMMDDLNPGYSVRVRQRMQQKREGSWWRPSDITPTRAKPWRGVWEVWGGPYPHCIRSFAAQNARHACTMGIPSLEGFLNLSLPRIYPSFKVFYKLIGIP